VYFLNHIFGVLSEDDEGKRAFAATGSTSFGLGTLHHDLF
jgi:hypothetical protein